VNLFINSFIGPVFIFILIFTDYIGKVHTSNRQRIIFFEVMLSCLIAAAFDFAARLLPGLSFKVSFIFQNLSYFLLLILMDFIAHKDTLRVRQCIIPLSCLFILISVLTILGVMEHFVIYLPLLLMLVFTISLHNILTKSQSVMLIVIILLNVFGCSLDIAFSHTDLVWPCYAAAILYIYLFIIKSDSKLDSLTGIGNRLAFNEFMEEIERGHGQWHVMMLDLDHFKEINDTYGHGEGDNALRDMASIIKGLIRRTDFAARYGGDEFIIAIPGAHDIHALTERLQSAIRNQNEKGGRPYKLQISIGFGLFPGSTIAQIDKMMYTQKAEHYRTEQ
jgi:diguanylate cyclase (GGDEF)-like protein